MITGYATVESAVEAVKSGAEEYVPKPFTDGELLAAVRRVLDKLRQRREAATQPARKPELAYGLIGESEPMQKVFAAIGKASSTSATVLITGESGTGKELVARAIHYSSARASAPFVRRQLRRHPREPARERAVRLRQGRVHRRRRDAGRVLPDRRRRHDLPRRDRARPARRHAGEAPAGAAGQGGSAWSAPRARGRSTCASSRLDQPRPAEARSRGTAARGSVLSPQRDHDRGAAAARARRRHSRCSRTTSRRSSPESWAERSTPSVLRDGAAGAAELHLAGQRARARERRSSASS